MSPPTTETAKHGLSNWLSQTWKNPTHKAASTARHAFIPALAAAVLMSSTLLACGSENASSSTDDDQPAVASTVQVQPDNDDGARTSRQATPPSADSSQDSATGSSATSATTAAEPTTNDQPTAKPKATATPEPTPTPTVVPTPTPDIRDSMFQIMKYGLLDEGPLFIPLENLRDQNIELIEEAIAPYVAEFTLEEYPVLSTFLTEGFEERIPDHLWIVELKQIPSDGEDLHVEVTMEYEQANLGSVVYLHNISVDVAIKAATPPYDNIALPIPGHRFEQELQETLDQMEYAPVFSHLLNDPVMGPGRER